MNDGICYIVGAGEDYGLDFALRPGDYLIAADGGFARTEAAGLTPDLIIGDFDSLGRVPLADHVRVLPAVKDVTDTYAAIQLGLEQGYRRFRLYGCTGGRFDHTMANLQTTAELAEQGVECVIVDQRQLITALSCGTLEFGPEHRGFVSVFSHTDRCTGVTLKGLKYELENAELTNRFPLGVSNEFLGIPSRITVKDGIVLLVLERI
ncbi:MAG: thiamine diphosphokinase [Clostridia bacterium]|nr:thiamine diphosphokinase [Clostridia bacterium]